MTSAERRGAPACISAWRALAVALLAVAVGCGTAEPGADDATTADGSGAGLDGLILDMSVLDSEPDLVPSLDLGGRGSGADGKASEVSGADGGGDVLGCSSAGCPCVSNGECDSGYCMESASGQVCAQTCVTSCPEGLTCKTISLPGGDSDSLCVPSHPRICEPCKVDTDCSSAVGAATSTCVPYVAENGALVGAFCGASCDATNACPSGYSCATVTSVGGVTSKQCKKTDLQCACDGRAIKLALGTACASANAAGKCPGTRACSVGGLSACSAPAAVSETCNDADDDCDGKTDEPDPGVCDDGSTCTYDNCVGGACQHPAATGDCNDGNACTQGDYCDAGKCKGSSVGCDDGNPCTTDKCDPLVGCKGIPADGPACSDGSVCTTGDTCKGGICLPGAATSCDDGNPCTTDACDKLTGCTYADNAAACNDGDVCTLTDACQKGKCIGTQNLPCSDGNPCTDDSCVAGKGCAFTNNSGPCDDGNGCTTGDQCKDGVCVPVTVNACDDGNPCTNDFCLPKEGCTHPANDLPCSDLNPCTVGDACKDGKCAPGGPKVCDDGNPCTTDLCDGAKGCIAISNADTCSDNNPCTEGDACISGKCTPGKPKACGDGNPCTDDSCDGGCVNAPNQAACSDGDICTLSDSCSSGKCVGGLKAPCDDGNACTDDSCDPKKGCVATPNSAVCSDDNQCTFGDGCKAGKCAPSGVQDCNDGDACTTDSCSPTAGCVNIYNTAPCDDGNPCTIGDVCAGGTCKAGQSSSCDDSNPCTDDGCTKTGCQHTANAAACSDGNACTAGDQCLAGKCQATGLTVCDDGNACTNDLCNAALGCSKANNTASCSDGSVCTGGDVCAAGVCKAGPTVVCNDGNPCTDDSCDPLKGCVFVNNTAKCDDKNGCTGGDICSGGSCTGPLACSPNGQCAPGATGVSCTCKTGYTGDGFTCTGICGDGIVAGTEKCDDKNASNGDGCDKNCAIEAGWDCIGSPSSCATICGDKLVVGAEQCDDGNNVTTDTCVACKNAFCGDGYIQNGVEACDSGAANSNTTPNACRTNCKTPSCGDKVVDNGETCDDGNTTPGDGCSATCQSEQVKCKNGTTLSQSPDGKAVLCQNPASCEQDKGLDCPGGFHLCTLGEFNTYNNGWNYAPPGTVIGAIGCRPSGGAGHLTLSGNLQTDVSSNCSWGSSNPWCTASYGCNELQGLGLCCVDNPSCGNKVVEPPLEACDDGNKVNGDGCDNTCMPTYPPGC